MAAEKFGMLFPVQNTAIYVGKLSFVGGVSVSTRPTHSSKAVLGAISLPLRHKHVLHPESALDYSIGSIDRPFSFTILYFTLNIHVFHIIRAPDVVQAYYYRFTAVCGTLHTACKHTDPGRGSYPYPCISSCWRSHHWGIPSQNRRNKYDIKCGIGKCGVTNETDQP